MDLADFEGLFYYKLLIPFLCVFSFLFMLFAPFYFQFLYLYIFVALLIFMSIKTFFMTLGSIVAFTRSWKILDRVEKRKQISSPFMKDEELSTF